LMRETDRQVNQQTEEKTICLAEVITIIPVLNSTLSLRLHRTCLT